MIIVVPEWLSHEGQESVLRGSVILSQLAEAGQIHKLHPIPPSQTPEAAWLGLNPQQVSLAQGPLTVAALGAEPPDRSVHFHLSPLTLDNGDITEPAVRKVPPEDLGALVSLAKKLDTRRLTVVPGEGLDHGLVWEEGSIELQTLRPDECAGRPLRQCLPEGDGETLLRRFIDDSVNLLDGSEMNERRRDEGLPPLNLLWPWGHGFRLPVPNLVLERGERALVISGSLRLAGLSRLVRYTHGDRELIGEGVNLKLGAVRDALAHGSLAIVVVEALERFRLVGQLEEVEYLTRRLERELLAPLLASATDTPLRLALVAPSTQTGLAMTFDSARRRQNTVPFDERALDERQTPVTTPWEYIEEALKPPVSPS